MYFLKVDFKSNGSLTNYYESGSEGNILINDSLLKGCSSNVICVDPIKLMKAEENLPKFVYLTNSIVTSKDYYTIYAVVLTSITNVYSKLTRKEVISKIIVDALVKGEIVSNEKEVLGVNEVDLDTFIDFECVTKYDSHYSTKNASELNITGYLRFDDIIKDVPSDISYWNKISKDYGRINSEFNSFIDNSIYKKAIKNLRKNNFYAHKGIYKVLARTINELDKVISPIVKDLYKKGRANTESYSVLDVINCMQYENVTYDKISNVVKLNVGGTLVLWIDTPNILYNEFEKNISNEPETQEYQKHLNQFYDENNEDEEENDEPRNEDTQESREKKKQIERMYKSYSDKLRKYNISRNILHSQCPSGSSNLYMARNFYRNFSVLKEYNLEALKSDMSVLHDILVSVIDNYKYCNIIIAYSDTIAYENNDFIDLIVPELLEQQSYGIISLSNPLFYNDENCIKNMVISTLNRLFNIEENKTEYNNIGIDKKEFDLITNQIVKHYTNRITNGLKDDSEFKFYSSIPSMTFMISLLAEEMYNNKGNEKLEEDIKTITHNKTSVSKSKQKKSEKESANDKNSENIPEFAKRLMEDFDGYLNGGFPSLPNLGWNEENNDDDADDYDEDQNSTTPKFKSKTDSTKTDVSAIDDMIGLDSIKENIRDFAALMAINKLKQKRELKTIIPSKHMIFKGNPGTAKTTMAMLLAHELYKNNTLARDNVLVVSRDQLVGKYVGWTAKNVAKYILDAKGGILFVDEAYSLVESKGTASYGQEAIDTFVRYMDDKQIRESTIIIFAGYKKEMDEFIETNPGIKSRIGFTWEFPDYSTDELIDIAKLQAKTKNIILSKEFLEKLKASIEEYKKDKDFGNGRFVRSVLEKSLMKQARRLFDENKKINEINDKDLLTLLAEDFSLVGIKAAKQKKSLGFVSNLID